jgi:autoinducer 2-degrading protein
MIVILIHVWVKDDFIDRFIEATIENHLSSIQETGIFRFDILHDAENPGKFVLYEAYENEQALAAHKITQHYFKWRDTIAEWMEQPRKGIKHTTIYPVDPALWKVK